MKQFNWEQDQIAHMKNYIARFGHGSAKLARQAKSKEKVNKYHNTHTHIFQEFFSHIGIFPIV